MNNDQPREELYRRPSLTITNVLSPVNAFKPRGGNKALFLSRGDSCGEDKPFAPSHGSLGWERASVFGRQSDGQVSI